MLVKGSFYYKTIWDRIRRKATACFVVIEPTDEGKLNLGRPYWRLSPLRMKKQ